MPHINVLLGEKLSVMRNIAKFVLIAAALISGSCLGSVPVFVTDVDIGNFSLPWYSPPNDLGGTNTMRSNMEGLYINQAYMTSDGVTHIVLKGTIDSGIPEGLLWSDILVAGTNSTGEYGTYGYTMSGGSYGGYGDFKIGTLSADTGGSLAIGGLDFSAEWVMAAPYSAVVIRGLVEDNVDVTITETNESLYLYSLDYRKTETKNEIFKPNNSGRMQKIAYYSNGNKPNSFKNANGKARGGYMVLISKKADPATAMIELDYRDGTKKKYNIDYSGVNFNEVELTSVTFQNPTPPVGSYSVGAGSVVEETLQYNNVAATNGNGNIYAGSISARAGTSPVSVPVPLLLRPLYEPAKKSAIDDGTDPRQNTTNMIHRIWFELADPSIYSKDNFALVWDDKTQSIKPYLKENAAPLYDEESVDITIHAELRKPYGGSNIREFTFSFEVLGDTPSP
ncbi:MAG: hypothetical protein LBB47_03995 [Spirochaetaceae bacterium]|jgi:hypothetical protein|nr:hypothetical protein [Spirochaetaceae bacterium]